MDSLSELLNKKRAASMDASEIKNCVVSLLFALCDALTISEDLNKKNADSLFTKCLKCLTSLEDAALNHEAICEFKGFLSNLINCFSIIKTKIPSLKDGSRKNAVQLYILQLKKCLPLLLKILKAKRSSKDQPMNRCSESEHYVLQRVNRCLSELRDNLQSEGDGVEGSATRGHHRELVETACGQFVILVDEALSLLAIPMHETVSEKTQATTEIAQENQKFRDCELCDVLSPKVEKILCLSMSVSHVAVSTKDAEAIVSSGQQVLRELQSLKGAFASLDDNFYEKNIHASNLSEALFCLEQRVNTALLRLVVEVFGDPFASLLHLLETSSRAEGPHETRCPEDLEDLIATYDLHMDRMVQIGVFAISCSNDRKRILGLRSCLASLESLEPELVPTAVSLYLNPSSEPKASHLRFLSAHWRQEVGELQFLLDGIVDPVAFCRVSLEEIRTLIVSMRRRSKGREDSEDPLVARIISRAQRTLSVLRHEGSDFLKRQSILISDLEFGIAECRAAHKIAFREGGVSKTEEENQKNRQRVMQRCLMIASMLRRLEAQMSEQSAVLSVCSLGRFDRTSAGIEERSPYRIGERSAVLLSEVGDGVGMEAQGEPSGSK
ncbi:serendipity locus protein alpha-like [Hetaerina americana]|uniref:serendipity locus protein alpha-like n=1 Tax=Hetaerina americana TaxID=62018 RepID=UPI003A7F27CF